MATGISESGLDVEQVIPRSYDWARTQQKYACMKYCEARIPLYLEIVALGIGLGAGLL